MYADKANVGRCCLCVPIRLGCFLLAAAQFVMGIFALCGLILQDPRFVSGGYSHTTLLITGIVGVIGIVFGFLGAVGAYDNNALFVRGFFIYYVMAIAAHLIVFVLDNITLATCSSYASSDAAYHHYNETLDGISRNGLCTWTRAAYGVAFSVEFLLGVYFALVLNRFWMILDSTPAYLITFNGSGGYMPGAWHKYDNMAREAAPFIASHMRPSG
ncbi:unnamed protein product [Vitrella brassicaformis CCMP3155]|uniref:Uncharacterized protein n=1 Tax=Vitrella brassicaformis (strain CCMP3155) TaxID=1169540 RepID=A0A0G4G097_VITBC|nr:unnamed protein product [Vitrella brassicaformis CCMP3155]|mmetsp:Transcript_35773/g.89073  ORF Transcript_35773/g.89073 Transcript_35773/m.89073 type:complete len:215 (-) Transcript_35773:317-961(-)|eukprot:CEM21275.1 unnamed protein product [Vitrella brassicaformis CCMP3155]